MIGTIGDNGGENKNDTNANTQVGCILGWALQGSRS